MPRPARVSPDRILAAAAPEFAERGYAGARVDRIARRARVNKAMLYYHFGSKQALYHALLRRTFNTAAERIQAIGAAGGSPAEKVDRIVAGMAALIHEHEFLPAIMLREMAEGGAHLDRETLDALVGVPRAVAAVVMEGVAKGVFRQVHPMFAYLSMVAPIVVFMASAPIRKELAERHLMDLHALTPDEFVRQLQGALRRALAPDRLATPPPAPPREAHPARRGT